MPTSSDSLYLQIPEPGTSVLNEHGIEDAFIEKLRSLKYEYRQDITDRATLEANFREKFAALNRVRLTDTEFSWLMEEIVTRIPAVPAKYRTLIPDYIKDCVSLNQFAA